MYRATVSVRNPIVIAIAASRSFITISVTTVNTTYRSGRKCDWVAEKVAEGTGSAAADIPSEVTAEFRIKQSLPATGNNITMTVRHSCVNHSAKASAFF